MRFDTGAGMPPRPPAGTQSLQRAMALVRALLATGRHGASAQKLAQGAGLDRGTAHRMLQCLAAEGLLSYDDRTHKYHFGPLAYDVGLAATERLDFRRLCKPTLARIAENTGDTVFLIVRNGDDAVCMDRASGSYPIKTFVVDVGTRRPLGVGAGSLAILCALPEEVAELVLSQNAVRFSGYPGLSGERVRQLMAQGRQTGFVAMDVVGVPGARTVGVPVCVSGGKAVAALSVAAITARMAPERESALAKLLIKEAQDLGAVLDMQMAASR